MNPPAVRSRRSRPPICLVVSALFSVAALPAFADVYTFYGIDLGSGPGSDVRPESDAAREDFLSAIVPGTVGIEDFEDETVGPIPTAASIGLEFPATATTGLLLMQSGFAGSVEEADLAGVFASSGVRYLSVGATGGQNYFTLSFSAPISAFGFYGSSISNFATFGNFAPSGVRLDGGDLIDLVNLPTGSIPSNSASFFGLVSDTPFTEVTLVNPAIGTSDGIGIDDITVPAPAAHSQLLAGLLGLVGHALRRRRQR